MSTDAPEHRPIACRPVRLLTLAAGFVCLGLGIAGMFLPVMPTTIFLLLALWCFSRSSERLQRWLYDHPPFGHAFRQWPPPRVIPPKPRVAALALLPPTFPATSYSSPGPWFFRGFVA